MVELTPRQRVKALARGEETPRVLLAPIIFSLGARLENLPLGDFQKNPTRVASAARQIRGALKVDAVTCYWDPWLEAEALGCRNGANPSGSPSSTSSPVDGLRRNFSSLPAWGEKGRVPIAVDVLRRLRVMLKDETALMVRVTGPFTLARHLSGSAPMILPELVDFAAEVAAAEVNGFLEAGADLVLLAEEVLPPDSREIRDHWADLLAPIANMVRFYEALPVLLLADPNASRESLQAIAGRDWDCMVCTPLLDIRCKAASKCGIALPISVFAQDQPVNLDMVRQIRDLRPALLTTVADLPASFDFKQVSRVLESLAGSSCPAL